MKMLILCFRNLFRNIRRTIAILLTVALGAGALFCFKGFINGVLTDYSESTIHAHYGNGQIHTLGYRDTVYTKPWKHWISNWGEVTGFLLKNPHVKQVFPRISIGGMLIHDDASFTGQGQGIDAREEALFFDRLNIVEGQTLSDQADGILLGRGLAQVLNVHPGDKVTFYTKAFDGSINKGKFTVSGIFHTGNADFDKHVFRIQIAKAQELLQTDQVESISVGLKDQTHWNDVAQSMR